MSSGPGGSSPWHVIGSAPGVCHPLRSFNILIPLTPQAPTNHVTPDPSHPEQGLMWLLAWSGFTSSLTSGAGPGEKRALGPGSRVSLIHRPGSRLFFVCAYDTGSASPVRKSTFLASLVTMVAAAPKLHEGPQGQMGGRWLEAQVHTVKTSPGALGAPLQLAQGWGAANRQPPQAQHEQCS